MQSEDFDNKIREAADHHHPAYDEKAWGKMEALLDKHLPEEKKDRRRIIFFLLLFLLLGGAIWLGINNRHGQKDHTITAAKQQEAQPSAVSETTKPVSVPAATTISPDEVNNRITTNTTIYADNTKEIPVTSVKEEKTNPLSIATSKNKKEINTVPLLSNKNKGDKNTTAFLSVNKGKSKHNEMTAKNTGNENVTTTPNNKLITGNTVTSFPVSDKQTAETVSDKTQTAVADTKGIAANEKKEIAPVDAKKETQPDPLTKTPDIKKAKNKKGNSFFVTVSAGPDISFSGSDKLGKTKLVTGAGLGYTFKDRLTIRTGFYSGRKVYSASPGEYHPPANFWMYYPYLEKVDADCKVYEIPLSVSYNFGQSSKANWFASTGLSSYLMKKEIYNYSYKQTQGGQTLHQKWTVNDENKHYFSVLTLSAGYKRNISKNVFVTAEPYLKLPLAGVGYGKVKLNSGGMLFTIGIKPFGVAKKSR